MKNEVKQYQCIGRKAIAVNHFSKAANITAKELDFEKWRTDPANQYATDAQDGTYDTDRFEEIWSESKDGIRWESCVIDGYDPILRTGYKHSLFLRLKQNQQVKETKEAETVEAKAQIVADVLGIDTTDLCLNDLCNYHVQLGDVFESMDRYAASRTPDSIAILENRIAGYQQEIDAEILSPKGIDSANVRIIELKNILKEIKK